MVRTSSKSRQIVVADVENLINRMNKTSFSGGGKRRLFYMLIGYNLWLSINY